MSNCAIKIEDITMPNNQNETLSADVTKEIDHWVAKFPDDQKQSAVIPALAAAQEANDGYLTNGLIEAVADYLDMPRIAAFEAATFYSMFELQPVGKHKISICTNISCQLCDSDKVVEHLEQKLNIKLGQTTEDGKFTIKAVECLGACVGAPMMQIGDNYHEHLTPEKIDKILEGLK